MPNINDMIPTKYLKKEDVGEGALVTIAGVEQVNMAKEGETPILKWILHANGASKPMVLNSTNIHAIAMICQSDDTDQWVGKEIVLYNDPNVSFAGEVTGGIRIRAKRIKPVTQNF